MAWFDRFGIRQGLMNECGQRIKALREEVGMSQLELANKISVPVEELQLWEQSSMKNFPPSKYIDRIAHILNSTYYYLLQGFDEDYIANRWGEDIYKKILRYAILNNNISYDVLENRFSINEIHGQIVIEYLVRNKYIVKNESSSWDILVDKDKFEEIFGEPLECKSN